MIEEDKDFVTQYFDMPDTDFADMERMSPWLLRIELNREMLTDKGLNMSRIADTITSEFGDEMSVIFTDDNAPKHILRVGFTAAALVTADVARSRLKILKRDCASEAELYHMLLVNVHMPRLNYPCMSCIFFLALRYCCQVVMCSACNMCSVLTYETWCRFACLGRREARTSMACKNTVMMSSSRRLSLTYSRR